MSERIGGRVPVLECLRAGRRRPRRLFLLHTGKDLEVISEAAAGIPIKMCGRQELDALLGGMNHQGVVLEADPLPVVDPKTWLTQTLPDDALVVLLDGIEDPHNFGAIVRSAAACGANAVVFGKDRAAPLSPAAVKSAAGGMEYVDLVRATNLSRCMVLLKKAGFWLAGLDAGGDQLLWEADLTGRIGIVVGSEGKGMRRLVGEHCDMHLRIPLAGAIDSLNASVSAGIALGEVLRQRRVKGKE